MSDNENGHNGEEHAEKKRRVSEEGDGGGEGAGGEPKPEPGSAEHINIKVKDSDGSETFFKIKTTTKMEKLMRAYADRKGKLLQNVRFLVEGQRVAADDTPASLDMEDNDTIEVHIEQVGGAGVEGSSSYTSRPCLPS